MALNDLKDLIDALEQERKKAETALNTTRQLVAKTEKELSRLEALADARSQVLQGITLSIDTLKGLEVQKDG